MCVEFVFYNPIKSSFMHEKTTSEVQCSAVQCSDVCVCVRPGLYFCFNAYLGRDTERGNYA